MAKPPEVIPFESRKTLCFLGATISREQSDGLGGLVDFDQARGLPHVGDVISARDRAPGGSGWRRPRLRCTRRSPRCRRRGRRRRRPTSGHPAKRRRRGPARCAHPAPAAPGRWRRSRAARSCRGSPWPGCGHRARRPGPSRPRCDRRAGIAAAGWGDPTGRRGPPAMSARFRPSGAKTILPTGLGLGSGSAADRAGTWPASRRPGRTDGRRNGSSPQTAITTSPAGRKAGKLEPWPNPAAARPSRRPVTPSHRVRSPVASATCEPPAVRGPLASSRCATRAWQSDRASAPGEVVDDGLESPIFRLRAGSHWLDQLDSPRARCHPARAGRAFRAPADRPFSASEVVPSLRSQASTHPAVVRGEELRAVSRERHRARR